MTSILTLQNSAVGMANPFAGTDHQLASWFHAHLTYALVSLLRVFSEPGSGELIGVVLFFAVLILIWKRSWLALVTLIMAVPGGMLLNEWLKVIVHRPRPFSAGPFVDWSGYSFASGHTIGATLLYGQLLLFLFPMVKSRALRKTIVLLAAGLVLLVGFSRIALGAHYLTDVVAAIFFGILWLLFCDVAGRPIRRRRTPLAVGETTALSLGQQPAVVPIQKPENVFR
jgi:membrane-associated phospholipid phosphatase